MMAKVNKYQPKAPSPDPVPARGALSAREGAAAESVVPPLREGAAAESVVPPLREGGYSRWLNRTRRGIVKPVGGVEIAYWPPGMIVLLPNYVAGDALNMGLTFKGEVE